MKVVCIDDEWEDAFYFPYITFPVKNGIYTVRGRLSHDGKKGYLLEEIINPIMEWESGSFEVAFNVKAFRPLTDISALTRLTKLRELEDA